MQVQSEQLVTIATRLEKLRRELGLNWSELAVRLGVSRVMLHYLRTGEKPLGIKLDYRIRQVEEQAGLLKAAATRAVALSPQQAIPFEKWLQVLKRRWQRKKSDRDEIVLAIRVLFPDHAKEILAWLTKGGK